MCAALECVTVFLDADRWVTKVPVVPGDTVCFKPWRITNYDGVEKRVAITQGRWQTSAGFDQLGNMITPKLYFSHNYGRFITCLVLASCVIDPMVVGMPFTELSVGMSTQALVGLVSETILIIASPENASDHFAVLR